MDNMISVILIVFIVFVCVIAVFALIMLLRDLKQKKQGGSAEGDASSTYEINGVTNMVIDGDIRIAICGGTMRLSAKEQEAREKIAETDAELVAAAMEEPAMTDEPSDGVFIRRSPAETHKEKYDKLPDDIKKYYDVIAEHAANTAGATGGISAAAEKYRIGRAPLITLKIRRDTLHCLFAAESDLNRIANDNGVKTKNGETDLIVNDDASVQAAISMTDYTANAIREARAKRRRTGKTSAGE